MGAKPESEAIIVLDAQSLKAMLVSLDKGIKANETMRLKHEGDPSKFMETELDLHSVVQDLHAMAAAPELYPILLEHGSSFDNLIGLLGHANTDIVVVVLELFVEMSDVSDDASEEDEQRVLSFVTKWVNERGPWRASCRPLSVLTGYWKRGIMYQPQQRGITAALTLLENLLEAEKLTANFEGDEKSPAVTSTLFTKTDVLSTLCSIFSKGKGFHPLKLHASEVVSDLLGRGRRISRRTKSGLFRLQSLSCKLKQHTAKKFPTLGSEEEYFLNIALSLSSFCNLHDDCRQKLLEIEAVELQMIILKQHAGDVNVQGALQVLSFLTKDSTSAALKAVDLGALKHVFQFLMGRRALILANGNGKGENASISSSAETRLVQKYAISVVANLVMLLHNSSSLDASTRLALKMAENKAEKLRKACELFVKYHTSVLGVEIEARDAAQALQLQVKQLSEAYNESKERGSDKATARAIQEAKAELSLMENKGVLYSKRLQHGLYELQLLAVIIAFGILYDASVIKDGKRSGSHVQICTDTLKKASERKSLTDEVGLFAVVEIIREYAAFLVRETQEGDQGARAAAQALMIEWAARTAQYL